MLLRHLLPFVLSLSAAASSLHRRNDTGLTKEVEWDSHSLFVKGQRIFLMTAEWHPWRQPNPDLWPDIFQKIKANGFNSVSFYTHWGTHYPSPDTNGGEGDFTPGTYRDIQRFIDEAKKAGLWLIARQVGPVLLPGPYINAETSGGGFPGWVGNVAGVLRTNNPSYTEAWMPYMTAMTKIIVRNQITEGGPIILVQAENEFKPAANNSPYMQAIVDLYKDLGVVVPVTHNDQGGGRNGYYSPDMPDLLGAVDIYCSDSYPQSGNRWGQVQNYYGVHQEKAKSSPQCFGEFGGGWLLGWGAVERGETGYEKYRNDLNGVDYQTVFYKDAYAQMATIFAVYMTYGGTNWGQTPSPVIYSSYDYGSAMNENRIVTPKMNELRLHGLFTAVSRDLLNGRQLYNGTGYTSNPAIFTTHIRNPQTGAGFYIIRHASTASAASVTATLDIETSVGELTIPKTGTVALNGRDSKIIVTDYVFGKSNARMLYSTTEVMTWTNIDESDYIVLYAKAGETGETAFVFAEEPVVDVSNAKGVTSSFANGTLTLNYGVDGGNKYVRVGPVVVVILEKSVAWSWHAPLIPGEGEFGNFFSIGTNQSVIVSGPYIIRTADISGGTLHLTGDNNGTTPLEFIAPAKVSKLTWNGRQTDITKTAHGAYAATLQGASSVQLPALTSGWKVSGGIPEISPEFDDSDFVTADQTTTNYTNLPVLEGRYVLYSQQYGFYGGHIIFRGHFNASGEETGFKLSVQGGYAFAYSAYFNGVYLGSNQGNSTVSVTSDTWSIPKDSLRVGKDNVLVVLMDHMGIVQTSTSQGKEPRGIRGYYILSSSSSTTTDFSLWKLQGNQGRAAGAPDTHRGYLNEGGLYHERIGAHLPRYPDNKWTSLPSPSLPSVKGTGLNFYRTEFQLNLPEEVDIPVRMRVAPSDKASNFRVQFYLNGWMVGKYINNIGPQTLYVLPAGILLRKSSNTLTVAIWSLDTAGASLKGLTLESDGEFPTSIRVPDMEGYEGYTWRDQESKRPKGEWVEPM